MLSEGRIALFLHVQIKVVITVISKPKRKIWYKLILHFSVFSQSEPNSPQRLVGKILIFSGKTGEVLRWVNTPDERETYFSPVIYTKKDGIELVLFGTGGETHPGGLWIVSLQDLFHGLIENSKLIYKDDYKGIVLHNIPIFNRKRSTSCHLTNTIPPFLSSRKHPYPLWQKFFSMPLLSLLDFPKLVTDICVLTIVNSNIAGVMNPPVLVDLNKDGTVDIVMAMYNTTVAAFDGETHERLWGFDFVSSESYS